MSELPKRVLSTLLITGAQSPDKALSSLDLANKLGVGEALSWAALEELGRGGYVNSTPRDGVQRFYLSATGIIAASSTYS